MREIRLWLKFLALCVLACGLLLGVGMGWHRDYLKGRHRARQEAKATAEGYRLDAVLARTLVLAELPRVSSALHMIRGQQAARRNVLAKMDALCAAFPGQDAATAAKQNIGEDLSKLIEWERQIESECWEIAAARAAWREDVGELVANVERESGE